VHLAKLSADGRQLIYGTYLGGSANEFTETHGLFIDALGRAIIGATTLSTDFPTTAGAFQRQSGGNGGSGTGIGTNYPGDGFVAIVSADGRQLVASTYLGGRFGEGIEGISVDVLGRIHVTGASFSSNFPVTATAQQRLLAGGSDLFLAMLTPDLTRLLYATYLGGENDDQGRSSTVDTSGRSILVGQSSSTRWPLLNSIQLTPDTPEEGVIAIFSTLP
jgi:hypothetical protein